MFINKVFSNIVDYGITYDLLQFHYDLWIFKSVSGAISSARRMKCSPATSLNSKTFSAGYWRTQHRHLIDAVMQFGYPSVFVTISPYEWTFPFPQWIECAEQLTQCFHFAGNFLISGNPDLKRKFSGSQEISGKSGNLKKSNDIDKILSF